MKVAAITGAYSGLGAALSELLVKKGYLLKRLSSIWNLALKNGTSYCQDQKKNYKKRNNYRQ
ncbi:MAG: hypothetical protein AABX13_00480 [Nanoarchaeota archaeon]